MNTVLISDERDRQQNKHTDQDDALFVSRKIENSEQALHIIAKQVVIRLAFSLCYSCPVASLSFERSETSLIPFFVRARIR